jgi:hypothetical protein
MYEAIVGTSPQGIAVYIIDPGTGFPSQNTALAPLFANFTSGGSGENLAGPFLSPSAVSLTFASTTAGQNSAPQIISLKSIGGQAVSVTSINVSGTNASEFALAGNCLTTTLLAPQSSCSLSVTYSPANPSARLATITITGNSPTSPQLIPLSGTAVPPPAPAPEASFNTANPFSFPGQTTQGTSSAPQNITVSNTGNAPLHILGVALGGLNTSDYSVGNSSCSGTIAAAANCLIPVTFSPLAAGIRSLTISVTDDAANSPQVLTINATAAPAVSIAPPNGQTTTASVTAGQAAQYNLTATPGAGFNGMLTFVCSGVPFGATCNVPPSVAVSNGAPVNFTVSVATGSSGAFLPAPIAQRIPRQNDRPSPLGFLGFLAALCAAALALRLNQEAREIRRPLQIAVSFALVLTLVIHPQNFPSAAVATESPPLSERPQITRNPHCLYVTR